MIESKKVFLDTAPFIYYLEKHESYYRILKSLFIDWFKKDQEMITSVLAVEEYCVNPYRIKEFERVKTFEEFIDYMEIDVVPINEQIARKAAQIRAEYKGFKAMDALQLATAVIAGCDMFLTNDKQLRQFKEIKCITVDELE